MTWQMAPGYSTRIVCGMGLRGPSPRGTSSPETSPSQGARPIYGLGGVLALRPVCQNGLIELPQEARHTPAAGANLHLNATSSSSAFSFSPPKNPARLSTRTRRRTRTRGFLAQVSPHISHSDGKADSAPRGGTRPTSMHHRACRPRALTRRLEV